MNADNSEAINLTPSHLSLSKDQKAKLIAAIKLYNDLLRSNLATFKKNHPDVVATVVDPTGVFNNAVKSPRSLGATDATCTNKNGHSCVCSLVI
jgi:hypothetical protein